MSSDCLGLTYNGGNWHIIFWHLFVPSHTGIMTLWTSSSITVIIVRNNITLSTGTDMNSGAVKYLSKFPSFALCTAPSSLTSTDAPGHSHIVPVIALQAFVVVTRPRGTAVLVQLGSAHLAAPTCIWHCANTWRASQRLFGALAHSWAASSHLKKVEREISRLLLLLFF